MFEKGIGIRTWESIGQQAEEKIKEIVLDVLRVKYPQGGYQTDNCRRGDGIPRSYCIDYSLTNPVKEGTIEFTHDHLSDQSERDLKRMAHTQIETS